MFQNQQAVKDFNKAREANKTQLQKGKELGLDEAAQASKSLPKPCNPEAVQCDTSVNDALSP